LQGLTLRTRVQQQASDEPHTLNALLPIIPPKIILTIILGIPIIRIPSLLLLLLKQLCLLCIPLPLLLNQLGQRHGLVALVPLCLPWRKFLTAQREDRPEVLLPQAGIGCAGFAKPDL
jgi:hypothetical protein